jgi:hypothetical protein
LRSPFRDYVSVSSTIRTHDEALINMSQTHFDQFSAALRSLPDDELTDALERAEHVFNKAVRDHGMDAMFPRPVETGLPADGLLGVFSGHTAGEVAAVVGEVARGVGRRAASKGRSGGCRP